MWGVEFSSEWILQILRTGLWANREEGPRDSNAPMGPVVLTKAAALSDLSERAQSWKDVPICLSQQCSIFQQHLLYLGTPRHLREPMDGGQVDVESSEDLASFLDWFVLWGSAALTSVSTLVGGLCHVWVKNCSDDHIFQPLYLEESCMGVFMSDELCCQQHHPAVPKALSFSIYEMKMYGLDGQQVTLNSNFLCFQTIHEEVGKTALGNVTSEWNLISGDKDEDSIIRCSSMARDTCLVWGQMRSMLERGTVTLETLNSLEKTFIVWDCQKMEWTKQEFCIFAHYAETITICPFFVVKSN